MTEEFVDFCWRHDEANLEFILKNIFSFSGQQLKKYYSSKELQKTIRARSVISLPINLVNHLLINPNYLGPEVSIIWEDEEFIALHKPPFVHSHPQRYLDKNTLLNFLASKKKWEALLVNKENYDRGLLYRLDFETSGVMVLSKKEEAFKNLRENFHLLMKRKYYWAIVEGEFNQEGKWEHYFRSTGAKGEKQRVSEVPQEGSKKGELNVYRLEKLNNKSLLLIQLQTGLRHQIRAQLSSLGFPILGDELYGGASAPRLFLHAVYYEFSISLLDPKAELFSLYFDLDRALQVTHDVLRRLKG